MIRENDLEYFVDLKIILFNYVYQELVFPVKAQIYTAIYKICLNKF